MLIASHGFLAGEVILLYYRFDVLRSGQESEIALSGCENLLHGYFMENVYLQLILKMRRLKEENKIFIILY